MFLGFTKWASVFVLLATSLSVFSQSGNRSVNHVYLNEFIEERLAKLSGTNGISLRLSDVCDIETDPIADRVLREYGAVFVGSDFVTMPMRCIFDSEIRVDLFQEGLETETISFGATRIELQKVAAIALKAAVEEAAKLGKRITPLDGAIAGKRNYRDTLRIWNSRFFRALDHWVDKGKITRDEANYAATLPIKDQIKRVMAWEEKGYFFSTNFSISIFNSVAPPGTSQHLSLLAFDVVESFDPVVRQVMNKHGWFQTIRSDQPHFTFIGIPERDLPGRGLTPVRRGTRTYWVPNVRPG